MRHRGPDGEGALHWPNGSAGMVRLALVDLSARGQQPLWSPDGKVAILFNGEVYNHAEHRVTLAAKGYPFKSETDTEVVLALYLEHGLSFVERLRGMFAIALFDFRERGLEQPPTVVLARDPFGIKPLYLHQQNGTLAFASELSALRASGEFDVAIDREALADFLTFGFVLQPRTILEGVTMLERGTLQVFAPGRPVETRRYFVLPRAEPVRGEDFETASRRLFATLEDSVRLHSLADTPVGAFLSGGVDSSAIVALMHRFNPKLRTYTVRFTDAKLDESAQARAFANQLGCVHTEVDVADKDIPEHFEQFGGRLDQPSTDGFNTFLVSRAAAKDVKGVLSGLGGDEWFSGYPVVRRMAALEHKPVHRLFGRVAKVARAVSGSSPLGDQLARVASRSGPLEMWCAARRVFLPHQVMSLVGRNAGDGAERLMHTFPERLGDPEAIDLACQLDVWAYMGCQLLRDSDVTSMASSLELRVPFVDVELSRVARSIAAAHKLDPLDPSSPGKRVLIAAVQKLLPADLPRRPKRGFALPYEGWLAGPLKGFAAEALAQLSSRRLLGPIPPQLEVHQRWSLVALELWCRNFIDRA